MSLRIQVALLVSFAAIMIAVAWPSRHQRTVDRVAHPGMVELHEQSHLVAAGGLSAAQMRLHGDVILEIPERGIVVAAVGSDMKATVITQLRQEGEARFVQPVFTTTPDDADSTHYIPTEQIVLKLREPLLTHAVKELARSADCVVTEPIEWLSGGWVLRLPLGKDATVAVGQLAEDSRVAWAHPNWLMRLGERENIPNDPLFGNQWHLKNTGQGGGLPGADIKATFAWDLATGSGVTIAVIDSGVDPTHNDLTQTALGYNATLGSSGVGLAADGTGHGTGVAGVAAGTGNNGILLCGVARDSTIMPIRLLDGAGYGTALEQSSCIVYAVNNGADIITNSWGPDGVPFLLPGIVQSSFILAGTAGRGGKGCPIFWAAGNGNELITTDQYASSPYTISVGAVTNMDVRASYSDFGPELDLVAPSSGGTRNINTVMPANTYTSNFGGTSASAPMAAGIAALMIEVAPNLTSSSVRALLIQSAAKVFPSIANYGSTGHSTLYGHGRVDAYQAVIAVIAAMATLPPQINLALTTDGVGGVTIGINGMAPYGEWILGVSTAIFQPVGSGPLFGVGTDAIYTFVQPIGVLPFHSQADNTGGFSWSTTGVPLGFTCQAVAVEITPSVGVVSSNVVQITF